MLAEPFLVWTLFMIKEEKTLFALGYALTAFVLHPITGIAGLLTASLFQLKTPKRKDLFLIFLQLSKLYIFQLTLLAF